MKARADGSAAKLKQAEADCAELADIRVKLKNSPSSTTDATLVQQVGLPHVRISWMHGAAN